MGRIKNAYHRFKSTVQSPVFLKSLSKVAAGVAVVTAGATALDVRSQIKRDNIDAQNDAYFNNNDSSFEREESVQDNG